MAMVPPSPARVASEVNLGVDSSAAAVADMHSAAARIGVVDASLVTAEKSDSRSAGRRHSNLESFKVPPVLQKQDTIDSLAKTLEGKFENKRAERNNCGLTFRDPTIERD